MRKVNAAKSTGEVFSEIYATGRWGEPYSSGPGSSGRVAAAYADYVRELLRTTGARRAVDIGCGDFGVAAQFVDALESYHGLDVVAAMIDRNTAHHGGPGINFEVLDASTGVLPPADICFVRQVLQHLSNQQIAKILDRCAAYPMVVVTEHWPASEAQSRPNCDKSHGADTRLDRGSWVDITADPFRCHPVEEVLRVQPEHHLYQAGETIRTHLWRPTQRDSTA
ncbi:class I SAM-dependent methyltransferase [Actinopolymorpha sp. B11F2]|uniref:class I SAM-dependent methyltransferase n=1 Tax=Actinopolymorpha sp. B11F2 TaxID=3160862 RepID=UPI0032E5181D